MRFIKCSIFGGVIMLSMAPFAQAEIFNCNGKWTNRPCSGEVHATIPEQPATARPPGKSEKDSAIHELTMRTIEAGREFGVKFDISDVRAYCESPETSIDDCRERIADVHHSINDRTSQLSVARAEEKKVKLQEEANRLAEERNEIEANRPVAIIDERRIYVVPRDLPPGYPNGPIHVPGPHYQQGSASVGVQVGGVSSGENVTVSAGGTVSSVSGSTVTGTTVYGSNVSGAGPIPPGSSSAPVFRSDPPRFRGYQDPSRPR